MPGDQDLRLEIRLVCHRPEISFYCPLIRVSTARRRRWMTVAIGPEAGGALAALLPRIDTNALVRASLSGVLSGLLTAAFIAVLTRGYRRFRPPRRIGYDVLSSKPIGQVSASARRRWPYRWLPNTRQATAASATPGRAMWRPPIPP